MVSALHSVGIPFARGMPLWMESRYSGGPGLAIKEQQTMTLPRGLSLEDLGQQEVVICDKWQLRCVADGGGYFPVCYPPDAG